MMKSKPNKQTPSRERLLPHQPESTPPIYRKLREARFPLKQNQDSNNRPIEFKKKPYQQFQQQDTNLQCQQYYSSNQDLDEVKRSINLTQKLRSQSQESLSNRIYDSQEMIVKKKENQQKNGQQNNLRSSLTFGSMKDSLKNNLTSSQQFLEEKKMKNQIIEQIIKNSKKPNFKSQQFKKSLKQPTQAFLNCANNDGKKAKYRIISEEEEEEDLFYCSKCSIMLLQGGFQIEEISQKKKTELVQRRRDLDTMIFRINELQGRIKYHVNSLESKEHSQAMLQQKQKIEQTYDIILFIIEQMKAKDLESMAIASEQINKEKKKQRSRLYEKLTKLQSLKEEIEEVIPRMNEFSDPQMNSILHKVSNNISQYESYVPLQFTIKDENLESRLERIINEVHEYFVNNKKYTMQVSFDKHQTSNLEEESSRKPFRSLFTEEEKKQSSRYLQEEPNSYSPTFNSAG